MTDKRKKRARAIRAKTGVSYASAINQLNAQKKSDLDVLLAQLREQLGPLMQTSPELVEQALNSLRFDVTMGKASVHLNDLKSEVNTVNEVLSGKREERHTAFMDEVLKEHTESVRQKEEKAKEAKRWGVAPEDLSDEDWEYYKEKPVPEFSVQDDPPDGYKRPITINDISTFWAKPGVRDGNYSEVTETRPKPSAPHGVAFGRASSRIRALRPPKNWRGFVWMPYEELTSELKSLFEQHTEFPVPLNRPSAEFVSELFHRLLNNVPEDCEGVVATADTWGFSRYFVGTVKKSNLEHFKSRLRPLPQWLQKEIDLEPVQELRDWEKNPDPKKPSRAWRAKFPKHHIETCEKVLLTYPTLVSEYYDLYLRRQDTKDHYRKLVELYKEESPETNWQGILQHLLAEGLEIRLPKIFRTAQTVDFPLVNFDELLSVYIKS